MRLGRQCLADRYRARGRQFRHGREQRTRPGRRVQLPDAHGGAVGRRKSADSAGGVTADYNAFYSQGPATDYSWAGASYSDPAAFAAATSQGTHHFTLTAPVTESPAEGSPVINSANCSAPGEPSTDFHGQPWLRDPLATDASLGNRGRYASRGAFARRDTLPLTFTAPALNSAGYPAGTVPYSTGVTITGDGTSAWGEPVSYTVDFGDGSSSAPATPGTALTHVYPTAGQYTITLTATDTSGMTVDANVGTVYALPGSGPTAGLSAAPAGLGTTTGIESDTAVFTASPASTGWEIAGSVISYGGSGTGSGPGHRRHLGVHVRSAGHLHRHHHRDRQDRPKLHRQGHDHRRR